MPMSRQIRKTIMIVPPENQKISGKMVFVEISDEFGNKDTKTYFYPASTRVYQIWANPGNSVTTWIKNYKDFPDGRRVFSEKTNVLTFDIEPNNTAQERINQVESPNSIFVLED